MEREVFELFRQSAQQQAPQQPSSITPGKPSTSQEECTQRQLSRANLREPQKEAQAQMLREVAQMTVHSFQSSQEAMGAALEVIGRFLDCQTLFIGRVNNSKTEKISDQQDVNQHTLKIMEVINKDTTLPEAGSEGALNRTYCQTVWQTGKPLIVEDSENQPFYRQLATTRDYNIGFYIGVPLIYSDGRVYGTLCAQDPRPRLLSEQPENLELMQIVARFLISIIEREELMQQLREAEHVQAQLARQEQQARAEADQRVRELEAIFEAMGDGLLVCDSHGRLQMNAAARQFLPMALLQGDIQHILEQHAKEPLVWGEDGQPLDTECWPISRVLRGEQLTGASAVNIQRFNAQGERRYLNISGTPIYNQQQEIEGAVLVFRDMTERYLLERSTQETNRRFQEFLSIASHELKGPLTTIQGNIQLAQRTMHTLLSRQTQEQTASAEELEKLQRYLARAARQVHVQDRLASDLIDVSRIRAGKLELQMQSCDLGQIVSDTVDDQRQAAPDRVINLDLAARQMVIFGDADRLGQVIRNYLTNALKYSASEQPVAISVTTDGIVARVAVTDQGTGLTPDEQKRVWERFYRAKGVRVLSGSGIGLGLGLHICKIIIELHGGCVGLDSTPGAGSCFWFTLPLSSA